MASSWHKHHPFTRVPFEKIGTAATTYSKRRSARPNNGANQFEKRLIPARFNIGISIP